MRFRALRLLYFLEDSPRFLKHLDRNFDGYFPIRPCDFFPPTDSDHHRAFRFSGIELPPVLLRLKQRSAVDAENFLAALSSDKNETAAPASGTSAVQINQRGVSNLPAWMSQDGGNVAASAHPDRTEAPAPSPPPPSGFKVPPPKRVEADALSDSPPRGRAAVAHSASAADRSTGERGVSNLPAWMTQDTASAAATGAGESVIATASASCAPPPPPTSEIKVPVPKTAAEAAAAFPLLSLAASAGGKRDRADSAECASSSSSFKRLRENSAADMFQEVALLLQDTESGASSEQQRLEILISNVVQSDDGLRNVRCCSFRTFLLSFVQPECLTNRCEIFISRF
jgi:hypothetical protein